MSKFGLTYKPKSELRNECFPRQRCVHIVVCARVPCVLKQTNRQINKLYQTNRRRAPSDYTFFGVDVEKIQKSDIGLVVVAAIANGP